MNRVWKHAVLAVLLCVAAVVAVAPAANGQEPQAMLTYDGAVLTVGDRARVTAEVTHPAGTIAIFPALGHGWGEFEVLGQSPVEVTENQDGTLTSRQTLELVLFAPGEAATPVLGVTISDRMGALVRVEAAPVSVRVESVLTPADVAPRDLKPQATLHGGIPDAWRLFSGLAAIVLAIVGGWQLWRRMGRRILGGTPLERALDELAAIAAAGYPRQGRYKELYLAVTQTVRHHLERESGVRMRDRTTSELRSALRQVALPAETARRFLSLCAESDLVKFAQVTPTPASAEALLAEAGAVVNAVSDACAANAVALQQPATQGAPVPR